MKARTQLVRRAFFAIALAITSSGARPLFAAEPPERKPDAKDEKASASDAPKARSEATDDPVPAPPASSTGGAKTDAKGDSEAVSEAVSEAAAPNADENLPKQNDAAQAGLTVERLPPSAYPEPRVRGIYGGSLWLTFHGLQWPYVPQLGARPATVLGLSGSLWVDGGYQRLEIGKENTSPTSRQVVQGRAVLRATPTYTDGDKFVQAQVELVANSDQTQARTLAPDTDDLWVRAGIWNQFDVQVGRYEAWELYHYGLGLDLNTLEREGASDPTYPVPTYGVTYIFRRPDAALHIAGHYYFRDFLRFELLGQVGQEANLNVRGIRPTAVLDLGVVKVKGGVEYRKGEAIRDGSLEDKLEQGGGGAVQVVLDPLFEAGISGAYGLSDRTSESGVRDPETTLTTYTLGGFANVRVVGDLMVGAGAHYTRQEDHEFDTVKGRYGEFLHLQTFAAVQYILAKQLFIKAVAAWAEASIDNTGGDISPYYYNDMYSARLRLMYLF